MQIDVHDAESQLSNLFDKAKVGGEIIITKEDALVQLVSKSSSKKKEPFPFGIMKGMQMKGFDEPLPRDIAEPFGMVEPGSSNLYICVKSMNSIN